MGKIGVRAPSEFQGFWSKVGEVLLAPLVVSTYWVLVVGWCVFFASYF